MGEHGAFWCPECGPGGFADEDGCCANCGATAVGRGSELALKQEVEIFALRAKLTAAKRKLRYWQTDWTNLCAAIAMSPTTVQRMSHNGLVIMNIDHVRQRLIDKYYSLQDAREKVFAALDAGKGEGHELPVGA